VWNVVPVAQAISESFMMLTVVVWKDVLNELFILTAGMEINFNHHQWRT